MDINAAWDMMNDAQECGERDEASDFAQMILDRIRGGGFLPRVAGEGVNVVEQCENVLSSSFWDTA